MTCGITPLQPVLSKNSAVVNMSNREQICLSRVQWTCRGCGGNHQEGAEQFLTRERNKLLSLLSTELELEWGQDRTCSNGDWDKDEEWMQTKPRVDMSQRAESEISLEFHPRCCCALACQLRKSKRAMTVSAQNDVPKSRCEHVFQVNFGV